MDRRFDSIIDEIKKSEKFLVVSHVNPEGDAIGSLLGMTLALRKMGKDATAYLEDELPEMFTFLPGAETIVHALEGKGPFDATIAVDCGQKERLGKDFVGLGEPGTIINLDHHATNDRFGDLNVVEPEASAAGEIVYDLLKAIGCEITPEVATNLYVAIHTDTGSFRYSSSTADAFTKAGELVRLGADPWQISKVVYENYPEEKFRLLGMVLSTLDVITTMDSSGKVAMMHVTREMFDKAGADKDLADGFVNYARGIRGAEAGVLIRELAPGEYKVSLRSKGEMDVARVAQSFGGGGHRKAAGFNMSGTLDTVRSRVVEALKRELTDREKV